MVAENRKDLTKGEMWVPSTRIGLLSLRLSLGSVTTDSSAAQRRTTPPTQDVLDDRRQG